MSLPEAIKILNRAGIDVAEIKENFYLHGDFEVKWDEEDIIKYANDL